jgi:hypothetical protein
MQNKEQAPMAGRVRSPFSLLLSFRNGSARGRCLRTATIALALATLSSVGLRERVPVACGHEPH